jgi:5-dehydro-4-deoxyglucarate dehydratase
MFPKELKEKLKDVHAYAVTVFKRDHGLGLDLEGFARNLEWAAEEGVRVFAVAGGTGENEALTPAERELLARRALEAVGRQALVIPTLPGNWGEAVELAPRYEKMGAQVVLAMAPYIRQQVPEELEGVFQYYAGLARASGLALLPYNTQAWPAQFFERLAQVEAIIGIKDPCFEPHNLFRAIRRLGDRFAWVGNKRHDPGVLQYRFQAGIEGFTAAFLNFAPRFELELFAAAKRRDWERMVELQEQLAPLERLRGRHGDVSMVKAALDLVGLAGGPVRPPRVEVSEAGRREIAAELERLGVERLSS